MGYGDGGGVRGRLAGRVSGERRVGCCAVGVGGVVGVEGDVVAGVPVAGGDLEGEGEGEEMVDGWGNGAAVRDGEGAVLGGFVLVRDEMDLCFEAGMLVGRM